MGWLERLKYGLQRTKAQLVSGLERAVGRHRRIDAALLEELEEVLLAADVGVATTAALLEELEARVRQQRLEEPSELIPVFEGLLKERLRAAQAPLNVREGADGGPTVILLLGVNGSGKTTTLAKLGWHLKARGLERLAFAAGDTFRAAAIEQLEVWARRVGAQLIKHQAGADPSAVAYDAVEHAVRSRLDALLIDTAGRLQTRHNLMEELKKIHRVIAKRLGRPADERLLVLDATTGGNALSQARKFHEAVPLTGLIVTKLDSSAKGGAILAITSELRLPVKFIGVGESADDLQPFVAEEFVEALF